MSRDKASNETLAAAVIDFVRSERRDISRVAVISELMMLGAWGDWPQATSEQWNDAVGEAIDGGMVNLTPSGRLRYVAPAEKPKGYDQQMDLFP